MKALTASCWGVSRGRKTAWYGEFKEIFRRFKGELRKITENYGELRRNYEEFTENYGELWRITENYGDFTELRWFGLVVGWPRR